MNVFSSKSHVRFLNDIPNSNSINIYMNGELFVENLNFGEQSNYLTISHGICNIEIYSINSPNTPISISTLDIPSNSKLTIIGEIYSNSISLRAVMDTSLSKRSNNPPNKLSIDSSIRFLHAVPNFSNVDVYINGSLTVSNLTFSSKSQYFKLSHGEYNIEIFESGLSELPFISETLVLDSSSNYTVSISILDKNPYLFNLKDGGIPLNPLFSYIRFINISPNSPLITMKLPNNSPLFKDVEYLETTGYYATSPGIYNFKVEFSNATSLYKNIKNINMINNEIYTIYVLGLFNENPPIGYLWVEDKN